PSPMPPRSRTPPAGAIGFPSFLLSCRCSFQDVSVIRRPGQANPPAFAALGAARGVHILPYCHQWLPVVDPHTEAGEHPPVDALLNAASLDRHAWIRPRAP